MFSTHPGIASWRHVHSQIIKKTNLESTLQLGRPNYEQVVKMTPKLVARGAQMHPHDIKKKCSRRAPLPLLYNTTQNPPL